MRRVCEHGADQLCRCGQCYCSDCFPGAVCPDCREGFSVRRVIGKFGPIRGLQVVGFCHAWVKLQRRFGEVPLRQLRAEIEEQGLSLRAAYRYVAYLEEWNRELGRAPGAVDDLAREIARGGLEPEPEKQDVPTSAHPATIRQA